MTSTVAPRRFSRVDVQLALQDTQCPDYLAQRILERLGVGENTTLGQQVARALEAVWQYNRPTFASPNTYGGMAWDRAHTEVGAAVAPATDIAQVWAVLDERLTSTELLVGYDRRAYEFYMWLCQAIVANEYGERPAPPPPPPATTGPQSLPRNLNQQLAQILVNPKAHQETMEIIEEQDFPMLFERSLMAIVRVWPMLPDGARRFAARQMAGWLRTIGVGAAAADQVETLGD